MKLLKLVLVAFLAITITNCTEDDDVETLEFNATNIAGTYNLTSFSAIETETETMNGASVITRYEEVGTSFNATFTFNANGSYTSTGTYDYTEETFENGTLVDSDSDTEDVSGVGTFTITNNTITLSSDDGPIPFIVTEFNSNELELGASEVSLKKAKTYILEPEQNDPNKYLIVANQPKKVKTATVKQKVEIIPDELPDPIEDPKPEPDPQPVEPSTTHNDTDTKIIPDGKPSDKPVVTSNTPTTTTMLGLHEMPLFPGCKERYDNDERKECFNSRIHRFVNRRFNTGLANELGLEPGSKIRIQIAFTIDTNGVVKDIKVRAPHPELKKEALRVINKLPVIVPGKVNGHSTK